MTITDEAREAWKWARDNHGTWSYPAVMADAIRSLVAQLMESEFRETHSCVDTVLADLKPMSIFALANLPNRKFVGPKCNDPRHNWTEEQWEKAAEEELSK